MTRHWGMLWGTETLTNVHKCMCTHAQGYWRQGDTGILAYMHTSMLTCVQIGVHQRTQTHLCPHMCTCPQWCETYRQTDRQYITLQCNTIICADVYVGIYCFIMFQCMSLYSIQYQYISMYEGLRHSGEHRHSCKFVRMCRSSSKTKQVRLLISDYAYLE